MAGVAVRAEVWHVGDPVFDQAMAGEDRGCGQRCACWCAVVPLLVHRACVRDVRVCRERCGSEGDAAEGRFWCGCACLRRWLVCDHGMPPLPVPVPDAATAAAALRAAGTELADARRRMSGLEIALADAQASLTAAQAAAADAVSRAAVRTAMHSGH